MSRSPGLRGFACCQSGLEQATFVSIERVATIAVARNHTLVPGHAKSRPVGSRAYFFSSLASARLACWPALETAFTNASALSGVDTRPERMFRNIMCLP
jgi:hypothetical protein